MSNTNQEKDCKVAWNRSLRKKAFKKKEDGEDEKEEEGGEEKKEEEDRAHELSPQSL